MKTMVRALTALCGVLVVSGSVDAQAWQMLGQESVSSTARHAAISFNDGASPVDRIRVRVRGPIQIASVELSLANGRSYTLPVRAAIAAGSHASIALPLHVRELRSANVVYRPSAGQTRSRGLISILGRAAPELTPVTVRPQVSQPNSALRLRASLQTSSGRPAVAMHRAASLARPSRTSVHRVSVRQSHKRRCVRGSCQVVLRR